MEIKLAIASIPKVEKVQKASKIHTIALYCIFPSFLRRYKRRVLLKCYSGNL